MKKIKYFTLALAFMFVFSFYSTGVATAGLNVSQDAFLVGIVYSTGGLGDKSFNDAAKRGIDASLAANSALTVVEACEANCDIPDIVEQIELLASDGAKDYDLIIGIGFSSFDGILASAQAHPTQNFMIIDAVVEESNVHSVVFKEQEGSFLVGAMAAMVSESGILGFLGGLDIPLINRFGAGFEHGAKAINPDIEVLVTYSPDPNNPWGDIAGGKDVANNFIEQGADVIFAAAGGTGLGVFEAAEEKNVGADNKVYGIGVDSDQDFESKGNVLASMIKRVDTAVIVQIDDVVAGTWSGGFTSLGIAENGVGISPMTFTSEEANATYKFGTTRWEQVMDFRQQIADGELVVVDNFGDLSTVEFESGGLPLPIVPTFLAIFSIVAIIRRKRK